MTTMNASIKEKSDPDICIEIVCESVTIKDSHFEAGLWPNGGVSAKLNIKLDGETLDSHSEQDICTAVVRFPYGGTAVVHFSLRVDGGKVVGKIVAGGRTRDVIKMVNVPVWRRTHLQGKP